MIREFNIDEYKSNPDEIVVTRGGYPVRIICTDVNADLPPEEHIEKHVLALVKTGYGEKIVAYYDNGMRYKFDKDDYDLYFLVEDIGECEVEDSSEDTSPAGKLVMITERLYDKVYPGEICVLDGYVREDGVTYGVVIKKDGTFVAAPIRILKYLSNTSNIKENEK